MESREHLEQMRRNVDERRRTVQDGLSELAAREFTGQDGDGCVRVTVDGRGAVRRVKVDPTRLRAIQGDELGRKVIEAVRAARNASAGAMTDVLRRLRDTPGQGRG